MDFVAVFLAAAAAFGTGAVWYSVNGRRWLAAVGRTEEEIKADRSPLPFIIAGLAALVAAGMMRHIFVTGGVSGFWPGLGTGFGLGAFVASPWILTNCAFANRPRDLWWIDPGYATLALTAMGIVLGLML